MSFATVHSANCKLSAMGALLCSYLLAMGSSLSFAAEPCESKLLIDSMGSYGHQKIASNCSAEQSNMVISLTTAAGIELVHRDIDNPGNGDLRLRCENHAAASIKLNIAYDEKKASWLIDANDASCKWQANRYACKPAGKLSALCVAESRQVLENKSTVKPQATVVMRSLNNEEIAPLQTWLGQQAIIFSYCAAQYENINTPFVRLTFWPDGGLAVAARQGEQVEMQAFQSCISERLKMRNPPYPKEDAVSIVWRMQN